MDIFENLVLLNELKWVVFEIIENLFEELKMVIMFCEIEGLSYEEIVEVMSCFVGIVCLCIFCVREVIDVKI